MQMRKTEGERETQRERKRRRKKQGTLKPKPGFLEHTVWLEAFSRQHREHKKKNVGESRV